MADDTWLDWGENAPPPPTTARSTAKLEGTIAALRAELAAAAPRLDAFARLEDLARERRTTPEAVAVQVTIDVLEEDREDLSREVAELTERRAEIADEIRELNDRCDNDRDELAMLTEQRNQIDVDLEAATLHHAELLAEITELLEDLESIRADGVRLLGEKAELQREIHQLRDEIADLRSNAEAHGARRSDDLANGHEIDTVSSRPTLANAEDFDSDSDAKTASAFDDFFEMDIGTDKARAWMLK